MTMKKKQEVEYMTPTGPKRGLCWESPTGQLCIRKVVCLTRPGKVTYFKLVTYRGHGATLFLGGVYKGPTS